MKTIKAIHDLVDYVADKGHTAPQRRKDIDNALYEASMMLFNEYLLQYESTSTVREYLSVFEVVKDYAPDNIETGLFPKPDDYERYVKISTKTGKPVTVSKTGQLDYMLTDPISPPTTEFPMARVGNVNIELYPIDQTLVLTYLKTPVKPEYKLDSGGVYDDSNSTDVEWTVSLFQKLVTHVLSKLGINLREQQIVQYSEIIKQQQ